MAPRPEVTEAAPVAEASEAVRAEPGAFGRVAGAGGSAAVHFRVLRGHRLFSRDFQRPSPLSRDPGLERPSPLHIGPKPVSINQFHRQMNWIESVSCLIGFDALNR